MADWTKDELEALPQTDTIFNVPALVVDQHSWVQEGYMIHDRCQPSTPTCVHAGIPIPSGKLLIKKGDSYDLIDEVRS